MRVSRCPSRGTGRIRRCLSWAGKGKRDVPLDPGTRGRRLAADALPRPPQPRSHARPRLPGRRRRYRGAPAFAGHPPQRATPAGYTPTRSGMTTQGRRWGTEASPTRAHLVPPSSPAACGRTRQVRWHPASQGPPPRAPASVRQPPLRPCLSSPTGTGRS